MHIELWPTYIGLAGLIALIASRPRLSFSLRRAMVALVLLCAVASGPVAYVRADRELRAEVARLERQRIDDPRRVINVTLICRNPDGFALAIKRTLDKAQESQEGWGYAMEDLAELLRLEHPHAFDHSSRPRSWGVDRLGEAKAWMENERRLREQAAELRRVIDRMIRNS